MKKEIRYKCIAIVFAITHVLSVQAYDFQYNGLFYNIISETERTVAFAPPPNINLYAGHLEIPQSVTQNVTGITYKVIAIGDCAFENCTQLTSITIPESVTSIGVGVFSGCSRLNSVMIPEGVTIIGSSAFSGCTQLTSVTIPESVTSIGGYAFANCYGLSSVTIPGTVTSIGVGVFSSCYALSSVTIPENVTSIGDYAFRGCSRLSSVTIPESVTTIGYYAFYRSGLSSVTIPESVTTIGGYAFANCFRLSSVTISESVTFIGDYAFANCTKLYEFICNPINIPQYIGNPFYAIGGGWCRLYVSKGSTGYDAWSPYFAEIIEVDFGGIDAPREVAETIRIIGRNLMVENVALQGNISIYNPSGQLIRSVIPDPSSKQICIDDLDKGMYFVVLQSAGASTTHKIIVP